MDKHRYTVIVSSCDKYEDLWEPFFKILKTEWKELGEKQIPIILNTEEKAFEYEGLNIRTLGLCKNGVILSWTARLRATLESIDTDYIILLLDDFFMQDPVKTEKISQYIKWMDENPRISTFCFKETYASKNIRDGKYEGFERRPLIGQYKFNCQAGLWRRDRLIEYLKKDENPWEWETIGNWRSYRHPSHLFYSHIPGVEHVFPYTYEISGTVFWGSGVYRGRWFVPSVDPVFKKHGINIDYSIRGTVSEKEFGVVKKREDAPMWKQKLWFLRPVYCSMVNAMNKFQLVLTHLDHFF